MTEPNDGWPSMDDTLHDFSERPPDDQGEFNKYVVRRMDYQDRVLRKILLLMMLGKSGGKFGVRIAAALGGVVTFCLAVYGALRGIKA